MKKLIVILICAVSLNALPMFVIAQETIATYTVSQFAGEEYHEGLKIDVQYDSKEDEVYLDVDARKVAKIICLKKDDRLKLINLLQKSLDWKLKADSLHANFEKEVGNINVTGGFIYGSKYKFDFDNNVTINFKGINKDNKPYETLIMMYIPKMIASDNEFMECDGHVLFLDKNGINELIVGLTTAIDEFNKKERNNNAVGNQFN